METADGGRLFVGVVTDTQWEVFCSELGEDALKTDSRLKTNAFRVKERGWLIPMLSDILRKYDQQALSARLEEIGLPFAPIAKPWDLLQDPHLNAHGGLLEIEVSGKRLHIPACPSRSMASGSSSGGTRQA